MQKVNYYCINYNALYADIAALLFQLLRKGSIILQGQPWDKKDKRDKITDNYQPSARRNAAMSTVCRFQ